MVFKIPEFPFTVNFTETRITKDVWCQKMIMQFHKTKAFMIKVD